MDEAITTRLQDLERRVRALEEKALQNTPLGPKPTCAEITANELEEVAERLRQNSLKPQTDIRE